MWLRPVGEIGCTKIRCVELGSRYLGHAVDATDPGGGGIPALRSRQRLARGKFGFLGDCRRDILRAMPLAVTDLTNSRREILIVPRLSLPEWLVLRARRYPCLDPTGQIS